ncbi:hypothetical protein BDW72DRAFT_53469 [Aspergillus terricola var. indicus]
MDALTQVLESTHLDNSPSQHSEQLLFNPSPDSNLARHALDNIPRYLFRIVSPKSDGQTDAEWVRSEAATLKTYSSRKDIFANLNPQSRKVVACTLNRHLRWWPKDDLHDNFVSWTSSLLFALQFIYYRHQSTRDGSALHDIRLYVVDTTSFPRGTFLRDLDLIDAFCGFDVSESPGKNLRDFRRLRNGDTWYFGEYLSQGSLRIAGKHQCISAAALFQDGLLYRLQPLFPDIHISADDGPRWAKEVVRFREQFMSASLSGDEVRNRFAALSDIMRLFDRNWKFPLAVHFASLIGPRAEDEGAVALGDFFRSEDIQAEIERVTLSEFHFIAPDTMPELTRAREIVHDVYMDFLARRAEEFARQAEMLVRHLRTEHVAELENAFPVAGSKQIMYTLLAKTLLSQFGQLRAACERVVDAYAFGKVIGHSLQSVMGSIRP